VASKARRPTCDDCYFRTYHLCALDLPEPCPTFRPAVRGRMAPVRQAPLVPPQPSYVPEPAYIRRARIAAGVA
jgi:hypothetical protein